MLLRSLPHIEEICLSKGGAITVGGLRGDMQCKHVYGIQVSAGTSPTVWTRGLATLGLAGTRGLASPIEELPSFKISPRLL